MKLFKRKDFFPTAIFAILFSLILCVIHTLFPNIFASPKGYVLLFLVFALAMVSGWYGKTMEKIKNPAAEVSSDKKMKRLIDFLFFSFANGVFLAMVFLVLKATTKINLDSFWSLFLVFFLSEFIFFSLFDNIFFRKFQKSNQEKKNSKEN